MRKVDRKRFAQTAGQVIDMDIYHKFKQICASRGLKMMPVLDYLTEEALKEFIEKYEKKDEDKEK